MSNAKEIKIKAKDDVLKGVYANQMIVGHAKEEFILDFISAFPPESILNARVIISPGHLKRVIRALQDNLGKYERKFGTVKEAPEPKPRKAGFIH